MGPQHTTDIDTPVNYYLFKLHVMIALLCTITTPHHCHACTNNVEMFKGRSFLESHHPSC